MGTRSWCSEILPIARLPVTRQTAGVGRASDCGAADVERAHRAAEPAEAANVRRESCKLERGDARDRTSKRYADTADVAVAEIDNDASAVRTRRARARCSHDRRGQRDAARERARQDCGKEARCAGSCCTTHGVILRGPVPRGPSRRQRAATPNSAATAVAVGKGGHPGLRTALRSDRSQLRVSAGLAPASPAIASMGLLR